MQLEREAVARIIAAALAEDIAWGDLTTDSLVAADQVGHARMVAREDGVLAGIEVAAQTFTTVDSALRVQIMVRDGRPFAAGTILATVAGSLAGMLKAERVALNFVQRLSGIASVTAQYVAAVAGTRARIIDTRKTTPGLRLIEKYAVRAGGGFNHRYCLADGVLVKDNHLAALRQAGRELRDAVMMLRWRIPHTLKIEVEVETLAQVKEALGAGAEAILLDNMNPEMLRQAVALIAGRAITEASGGVNLQTVRAIAESGVDLISVGALTHSAQALDIALDVEG